jgi:hypothetical protein
MRFRRSGRWAARPVVLAGALGGDEQGVPAHAALVPGRATPDSGGWQGPAHTQAVGTDGWRKRDLPPLLQDANPAIGPARFLTVGGAIVATTDGRSVGHQYVVTTDDGASWGDPLAYPCDYGDLETDPDHTALLAVCPADHGSSVWRATDLIHWSRLTDVPGIDAVADSTTDVPLGPDSWLFVGSQDRSATLATPEGTTHVQWPTGLGVTSAASIGSDLFAATVEMARDGRAGRYGGVYVSHDGGRTWERDG